MEELKKSFLKGFLWTIFGQTGTLLITFLVNVILTRILSPYEFGQIAIVVFFISISRVLVESGLSGALVRKKDISEDDFSTVFIFNLSISLFLVLLIFAFSSLIADFYDNQELKWVLNILSLVLILNSFQFTYNAKIARDLNFRNQTLYNLISVSIGSSIGVIFAFFDYGIWALVIIQISNALILNLLYFVFEPFHNRWVFNRDSFKSLYKFGVNTTSASLINSVFDNIYILILGKFFSINQSGLFYQGKKLQEIPVSLIQSSTLGVVFSTLSKLQNNSYEFDKFYKRIISIFTVVTGFICLCLFLYSEQIIFLFYGKKWLGATFFMKIFTIASFFTLQEMFNRILFKVFDKTERILYLEIIKKSIQLVSIIIGLFLMDLKVLLYGFLISSIISYFINYYYSRKIYGKFSWGEIILVTKVVIVIILSVLFMHILNHFFKINGLYTFMLFPFVIIFYFILIKALGIINIDYQLKLIFNKLKIK